MLLSSIVVAHIGGITHPIGFSHCMCVCLCVSGCVCFLCVSVCVCVPFVSEGRVSSCSSPKAACEAVKGWASAQFRWSIITTAARHFPEEILSQARHNRAIIITSYHLPKLFCTSWVRLSECLEKKRERTNVTCVNHCDKTDSKARFVFYGHGSKTYFLGPLLKPRWWLEMIRARPWLHATLQPISGRSPSDFRPISIRSPSLTPVSLSRGFPFVAHSSCCPCTWLFLCVCVSLFLSCRQPGPSLFNSIQFSLFV